MVVEMKGRIRDCTPMRCEIVLLVQSTCFFQFKEGSNQRPRYLKQLTCSKDSPLMLSLSRPLPFRLPKSIVLIFVAFRVNLLTLSHWLTVSKSSFSCVWMFSTHFPETKNAVSSAYRTTLLCLTTLRKSSIYRVNSSRPNTEPWMQLR